MRRLSLFWQIFLTFGILTVFILGILGSILGVWLENQDLKDLEESLRFKALLIREILLDRSLEEAQPRLQELRKNLDVRFSLIAPDGTMLVDSESHVLKESRLNRPEIEQAQREGMGQSVRPSKSFRHSMLYVAVKAQSSEVGYVRVSIPFSQVQQHASLVRHVVWGTAGIMGVGALVLAWTLVRRIAQPLQDLRQGAQSVAGGDYGHKVYIDRLDEIGQLASSFNQMSLQLAYQFAQLDEDRQQLRAVLGSMVEGVIAIDGDQNILFANLRAGEMLDFPPRFAPGRKLWEVVRQHAIQDVIRATMSPHQANAHRLEWTGPTGKSLTVHVAPLPGDPVRGAVLVFHDTTELRRLEGLRQEFVANVSHELKTPLSVITACVETLQDGGVDDLEIRDRFLERIHDQAQRLSALIQDLLSLARIESGNELFSLQPLSLAQIAHDCRERFLARVQGKNQQLELLPPTGDPEVLVWADEEALYEILDNLVDNAVKYTPSGGRIQIAWWAENRQGVIEVRDTGIGIPEKELPRIFERFYRVDKARSREMGGTGLGLSIVKHLVQALHGTVKASSEEGKGSRFTIHIPQP